jgi:hypothetical protein
LYINITSTSLSICFGNGREYVNHKLDKKYDLVSKA